jgi:hypothetical protein
MLEETRQIKPFWQAYRAAVSSQGVPDSRADWFVRWAQQFAHAIPGIALRARTQADVGASLGELAQQAHVESWQDDQAQEALRAPYQLCLPLL